MSEPTRAQRTVRQEPSFAEGDGVGAPLDATSSWHQAVLDAANMAIITTGPTGLLRGFNRTAALWLGHTAAEVVGHCTLARFHDPAEIEARAAQLAKELGRPVAPDFEAFVARARGGAADENEWTYVTKDGFRFPVRVTVTALFCPRGELVGFLSIARDLSLERLAEAQLLDLGAELQRSEERFRAAAEGGFDGLFFLQHIRDATGALKDFRIVEVNSRAAALVGSPRAELLGARFLECFPGVAPDALRWRFAAAMETGEAFEVEIASKSSGGHWLLIQGVPLQDGIALKVRDIHEKKMAEEQLRTSLGEKEVLLLEVHHRVKNNLQVICSLLSLQAAQITNVAARDALGEAQMRVLAIAHAHEQLYASKDLALIDLGEHLHAVARTVSRSLGTHARNITIDLETAPSAVGIDVAIPCGLMVNELLSNSIKHAFPGRPGRVRIVLEALEDGVVRLVAEDDGVGLPVGFDSTVSASLGLKLITALTRQLGGTLVIGARAGGGARFQVQFQKSRNKG